MDAGFDVPSWDELSVALPTLQEDPEPNQPKASWQQKATRKLEVRFIRDEVWPGLDDAHKAFVARRLVLVSQNHTSVGVALQFDLRSDTEIVLSGPDVPGDAFGEDVKSVDEEGEIWSVAGTQGVVSEVEAEVEIAALGHRPLQAAFMALDQLSVEEIFKQRAFVMKVVAQLLKGPHRNAIRVVLEEAIAESHARQGGWKLFMVLPRMLLHCLPRGGIGLS